MGFQQGVSGLNAASRSLEVIGNNIANSSTIGFKTSRAEFADVYARAYGAGGVDAGLGTEVATVAQQFTQGSITTTENALDVAINGSGFFQLADPNGVVYYSRNGQFKVSHDGFVCDAQGYRLIGVPQTADAGMTPGRSGELRLPTTGIAPKETRVVDMEVNLDARQTVPVDGAGAPLPINFADPKTYNNSTSIGVYDAKGMPVTLTYFFQKTGNDAWNVYVAANGESVSLDGDGNPLPVTPATFPPDGKVPTDPAGPLTIDVPATAVGTTAETAPIAGLTINMTMLTQFASSFGPTDIAQDGFPPGRLSGVNIQEDGSVVANYTSGQSSVIAKLELANFRNPQGLQPVGGSLWAESHGSGDPVLGVPGGGNFGMLRSRALEQSTVDLTGELVAMMVAQRIYQANAQTIKTEDTVMQTLVSMR